MSYIQICLCTFLSCVYIVGVSHMHTEGTRGVIAMLHTTCSDVRTSDQLGSSVPEENIAVACVDGRGALSPLIPVYLTVI